MTLSVKAKSALEIAMAHKEASDEVIAAVDAAGAIDGSELIISGQVQGDVLYFNGTSWVRLAAGTNGQFLKTQGASANPAWASVAVGALTDAHIFVGDASNLPADVAMSGDATIARTGAVTIAAAAVTSAKLDEKTIKYAEVSLSRAQLLALNASPVTVVAAPGAGKVIEFISAVVISDFDTAAYTGGGALTINNSGGALSSTISAANSFGAATDKITQCVCLDTANGLALVDNGALTIVAAADFTDPGTAVGVGRVKVAYRVHTTGL